MRKCIKTDNVGNKKKLLIIGGVFQHCKLVEKRRIIS